MQATRSLGKTPISSLFLRQDVHQRRLPVVLLTGFLGSGKTTLVNALLRDPRLANTAVAVNEFGDVPLDRHLIDAGGERTFTLANGCLCCNLGGDVEASVMRIFARRQAGDLPRFERLLVEPSGLSDPAPIAQAILRNPVMSRALRLESILCAVDSMFAEQQLARQAEARKQIALADRIIITKTDMVDDAARQRVRAQIRRLNPAAEATFAAYGVADAATLLPPAWLDPGASVAPGHGRGVWFADDGPSHGEQTIAVGLSASRKLRWRNFDAWLRGVRIEHAEHVLRIKGIVHAAEANVPLAIQGIHHVLHPPVELAAWPEGITGTRIAILTQGLPNGTLQARWEAALPCMTADV